MASSTVALRSLNTTFVRKGIVAASTGDSGPRDLPSEVHTLLSKLKSECQDVCENARDVGSFIQLWKERSLHQTLQALDDAASAPATSSSSVLRDGGTSHEKQIQAIEMHEKAGREMNERLQRHRAETTKDTHLIIDQFAEQLTVVLAELIKPELEDELERERAIVNRLVQEKQQLVQTHLSLQQSNKELSSRVESLESAPNGGGDAILCNKLRDKVRELTANRSELLVSVADMEKEREKQRWDMVQMQKELENQQRTFFLTKAMHEKETKQLVALVQTRQAQFAQVMQASSSDGSMNVAAPSGVPSPGLSLPRAAGPVKRQFQVSTLEVYDSVSGHTIHHAAKSPQKQRGASDTNGSKTGFAFTASPPASPKRKASIASPSLALNQQQLRQDKDDETSPVLSEQPRSSPLVPSPSGQVRRFVFSDLSRKSLLNPQTRS